MSSKGFSAKTPRISFLTTCMNRLHHLVETLPKNVNWNLDYPNLEFIVLDYNSPDGLGEWIRRYMAKSIVSGTLVYYKYCESSYFRYSHSRNMLLRLASGNIVCNLDADNLTGRGFARYLIDKLKEVDFLTGAIISSAKIIPHSLDGVAMGCFGRIACSREILLKIGGYNEEIVHWGFEDRDLFLRLKGVGYSSDHIASPFLFSIPHGDNERGCNIQKNDLKLGKTLHDLNKMRSLKNIAEKKFILNNGYIGCGTVYKNFSEKPIVIEKI